MELNKEKSPLFNAYCVFLLAASFYMYEFILQVAPSVMAEPMMRTFHVTAEGFGVISAFYFYAYAPMQLPAGLLFDRYGPRRLMTTALIMCAFGSFFFASTESVVTACLGRFIIGIASAFSFIGVLVLVSRWFPAKRFALFAGIAQAMSSVGAITGEAPLAALTELVGWRKASFILAGVALILSTLLWRFIRDYPDNSTQKKPANHIKDELYRLIEVCKHAYTWIIGAYAFSIWTPIAVFAALWGVPYLQVKYNVSVVVASSMISMIWIGIGIGSPLLGWISDKISSRRFALALSSCLGLIASIAVFYVPNVSLMTMYLLLLLFGMGSSGQSISFAAINENNPPHLVGTASGFNNLCVLLGGAIFQPLVGRLLHQATNLQSAGFVHIYSEEVFKNALMVVPICYALSLLVVIFFLKESHPGRKI